MLSKLLLFAALFASEPQKRLAPFWADLYADAHQHDEAAFARDRAVLMDREQAFILALGSTPMEAFDEGRFHVTAYKGPVDVHPVGAVDLYAFTVVSEKAFDPPVIWTLGTADPSVLGFVWALQASSCDMVTGQSKGGQVKYYRTRDEAHPPSYEDVKKALTKALRKESWFPADTFVETSPGRPCDGSGYLKAPVALARSARSQIKPKDQ